MGHVLGYADTHDSTANVMDGELATGVRYAPAAGKDATGDNGVMIAGWAFGQNGKSRIFSDWSEKGWKMPGAASTDNTEVTNIAGLRIAGWVFGRNGESMTFSDRLAIGQNLLRGTSNDDTSESLTQKDKRQSSKLVSMTMDKGAEKSISAALEQVQNPWLSDFLLRKGEKNIHPNNDIMIVI